MRLDSNLAVECAPSFTASPIFVLKNAYIGSCIIWGNNQEGLVTKFAMYILYQGCSLVPKAGSKYYDQIVSFAGGTGIKKSGKKK